MKQNITLPYSFCLYLVINLFYGKVLMTCKLFQPNSALPSSPLCKPVNNEPITNIQCKI